MNILIAPDSFKGSITAQKFCEIGEKAIKREIPSAKVLKCPLADGGEGTVEALVYNTNGHIYNTMVIGPTGKQVEAFYGILGDGKTAVIEMASASGLPLVPDDLRNPYYTTTYGTGQLVKEVLDKGCNKIILGIGGSATNDGGAGMMQALGFQLLDKEDNDISYGGLNLKNLHTIRRENRDKRLDVTEFFVACDVNNPLLGPNGATYVYGPQKGATKDQLIVLDKALENYNRIIVKDLNKNVAEIEGAGAAGGLGAGLLAFLNVNLKPGFEIIKDMINFEKIFTENNIDLVITGEGEINYQTINGKLPVSVAKIAKKFTIPVIAIVGSIGEGAEKVYSEGIDSILTIIDGPRNLQYAMENSQELLFKAILRLVKIINLDIK